MSATGDLLREMGEVLREEGWTQNVAKNPYGERCLIGALTYVCFHSNQYDSAWIEPSSRAAAAPGMEKVIMKVIAEQYPGSARDRVTRLPLIPHWNDTPGRTLDEVLAVLDKAALRADEEEL